MRALAYGAPIDPDNITWIDLEMTGLYPKYHPRRGPSRILEAAVIVTTKDLEYVDEFGPLYVHQTEQALSDMNIWSRKAHFASGLVKKVRESRNSEQDVENKILQFLSHYVSAPDGVAKAILAGNSIAKDREFLREYMPKLDEYFNYRMLDVSSFKIAKNFWNEDIAPFEKREKHRAMDDIRESIAEMRYYRDNMF
jgi:oligoribonuclease